MGFRLRVLGTSAFGAFCLAFAAPPSANAAIVTYLLDIHPNLGTWEVFVSTPVEAGNEGIAAVSVALENVDTPVQLETPSRSTENRVRSCQRIV